MAKETAVFDTAGRFAGHEGRECGGHVASRGRAWCPDCSEWCYPDAERACRGCEIPCLSAEVADLRAENRRLREANANMSRDVERTLAAALGYPKYGDVDPDPPGNPDDYVTGDHTPGSLAAQAAHELAALRLAAGTHPPRHLPRSAYLRIAGGSGNPADWMTWPNPDDPGKVQWKLRYADLERADLLFAASVMDAYAHLFELPQKTRNIRVRQVRETRDELRGRGGDEDA